MTATTDSLKSAARIVADALLPLLSSLGSDASVGAFVADLGWTLPSVPPSIAALGIKGNAVLAALTDAEFAAEALDAGTGDAAALEQALATLVTRLADLASQISSLNTALAAELPAPFVSTTGIANAFPKRLLDHLAILALNDRASLMTALATLVGLVEQSDVDANQAQSQPAFTSRALRLDRVAPLVTKPQTVFADLYGWGTPTLNLARLFANLERLSYQLFGVIQTRSSSTALVSVAAPGAPTTGRPHAYVIPIHESGPVTVVIAVVPLPKAKPTDAQGIAITLQLKLADSAGYVLGPGLKLTIDGTLDLSSGVAAVLYPGKAPAIVLNPNGAPTTPVSGRGGARVTFGNSTGPTRLLTIPGGSYLEAAEVYFAAGVDATQGTPDFYIEGGITGGVLNINMSQADSFLASILPADGITAKLNLALAYSQRGGVRVSGSAGLQTVIPLNLSAGPFAVGSLTAGLAADSSALTLDVGVDGSAHIGPITASIGGIGVRARAEFRSGNLGPVNLSLGFKSPTSIGLSVDVGGVVSGSGFLFADQAQGLYAGAMRLTLHNQLTLTALGLIQTRLPDGQPGYSLLIFITAEGFQPIQLGLGFMLTGIGGMVGVNRTFDETVLREGLKTDTLATLLFPRDPASNAMAIVRSLASAFPPKAGSYLLGLLAKICWGPAQLLQFDLALILELGARTRLLALGRVSALVPSPDNDLVRLKGDVMGVLDLDAGTLAVDAVLVDSRVAHKFAITGAGAFRAGWGSGPGSAFIYSIGGFNPRFVPPAGLPTLDRVTVALASGSNPRFTCEAYFAITSNTLQFGARAELYASYGGFTLLGDVGFDVLMTSLSHFIADFHASVQLKRGSHNLFKVAVQGTLEGARPLRLSGKATFEILWCDFSVSFHATLVDGVAPVAAALDAIAPVLAALAQPENWRTVPGPTPHGVSLRKVPSGSALAVDPLGKLEVTQSVVPLGTARDVDTVGGARVSGDRRFNLTAQLGGGATTQTAPVFGSFAPGQYFAMSDDEKLASPSFETMQAGVGLGSDGVAIDESATGLVSASLTYQVLVLEGATLTPVVTATAVTHDVSVGKLVAQAATGAAAKAPVRQVGRSRFATEAGPAVTLPGPKWAIMPVMGGTSTPAAQVAVQQAMVRVGIADAMLAASTLAPQMMPPQSAPVPVINTWSEYRAVVDTLNQGGAAWQIVPEHELV